MWIKSKKFNFVEKNIKSVPPRRGRIYTLLNFAGTCCLPVLATLAKSPPLGKGYALPLSTVAPPPIRLSKIEFKRLYKRFKAVFQAAYSRVLFDCNIKTPVKAFCGFLWTFFYSLKYLFHCEFPFYP